MRRYESVWVVNGDLPDEEIKATIDKFTKIIENQGGTLVGVEEWGRRKLAYKIQGTLRGFYVIADFAGMSATVKELERNYRIDDRVIRYLTMKTADQVNLAALQAEQAAKAEEAAKAQEAARAAEEVARTAAETKEETSEKVAALAAIDTVDPAAESLEAESAPAAPEKEE